MSPADRRSRGTAGRLRALGGPPPVETSGPGAEVSLAVVLDLLDVACASGASVPGAMTVVGAAVAGERGAGLVRAASSLGLGAPWAEAWSGAPEEVLPVAEVLRPAWEDGMPPGGPLRAAAAAVRRDQHSAAMEAAGSLGTRLVLPLGLCYLPAFVLVGLVPVLLSMARSALGQG